MSAVTECPLNPPRLHLCVMSRTSDTVLCKRDLKAVRGKVLSVASKWYDVGLELDLSADELDAIKMANHDDPKDCLRDLISVWLSRIDLKPTWRALSSALRNPAVGQQALADTIEQHHCNFLPSETVSTSCYTKVKTLPIIKDAALEDTQVSLSKAGNNGEVSLAKKVLNNNRSI